MIVLAITLFKASLIFKIFATIKKSDSLKWLSTPLVTTSVLLIPLFVLFSSNNNVYTMYIGIGLVFSLIADIYMMHSEKVKLSFLMGVVFFLITHILYTIGFVKLVDFYNNFSIYTILAGVFIAIVGVYLNTKFKTDSKVLKYGLWVYTIALSIMWLCGLHTLDFQINRQTILIAIGVTCFLISDIVLSINAFWKPIPHSGLIIWGLYAPGQLLIAYSTL